MQWNSSDCGNLSDQRDFSSGRIGLIAIVIMVLIGVTGCPGNVATPLNPKDTKPFAGAALKIAGSDAAVLKAFASRAQGWAARNGATISLATINDADIVIVPPALVGAYAERGDALPVPEELKSLEHPGQWVRTLPIYRDRLAAWAGEPRAIPLAGDGAVLVIRTDRLGDAVLKQKYLAKFGRPLPLSPGTWEDLAEIAEACNGLSFAGVASRSQNVNDFLRVAACYDRPAMTESDREKSGSQSNASTAIISFTHTADNGLPRLTTPGFAAAAAWRRRIPTVDNDPLQAISSGHAACAVLSLAELGRLPRDANGMVPRSFAILPLPGTRKAFDPANGQSIVFNSQTNYVPFFSGGWFGVVRKKCASPDAAFDLLADLSNPARSLEMLSDPALGFGPFRHEHLEQNREMVWQGYGFDAARTHNLADALRRNAAVAVVNPALGLRGPDAEELAAILAKSLDDPKQAQAAWLAHDAKEPAAKNYRRHAAGLP